MSVKLKYLACTVLMVMVVACSTGNARLIKGKWSLAGIMIGGAPSSFWFKGRGKVIAPWETRNFALESTGSYEFIDEKHIKIMMKSGYYSGNTYYFEIIKLDEKELILRTNFQEVKMKRRDE